MSLQDSGDSSVDLSLLSEGGDDDERGEVQQQRQRGQHADDDGDAAEAGKDGGESGGEDADPAAAGKQQQVDGDGGERRQEGDEGERRRRKKKVSKVLTRERLQRLKEKHERRGIIYVSRIPPHMKPAKLRQLLSQYGEVGRVYCTPEDSAVRRKRKEHGGNTGKNFTEGWVEFEDKAVAKSVAAMLNNQPIGGKHRSAYHFDLWCLKYLPKFKWDHLTEEINYEKAVREQKLAAELSTAKRERDFYLSRVDQAKALAAMEQRRAARGGGGGGADGASAGADGARGVGPAAARPEAGQAGNGGGEGEGGKGGARPKAARHYGQRRVKPDPVTAADAPQVGADVLGMVVANKRRKVQPQG